MKIQNKYALTFLIIHILVTAGAFFWLVDPNVPNSDLNLIIFPNIFIPALFVYQLPYVFGAWSGLIWGGIFWLIVGFGIGLIVQKRRLIKLNKQQSS